MRAAKAAEMTARVDEIGIQMTGPHSHSFHDWRDIEAIIEGRRVIVAAFGNQGWIFSDRMLAGAGDPAELRLQIIAWHSAATEEAAS
jgi:hypothetical protein